MTDTELRTLLEVLRREANARTESLSATLAELTHDRSSQSDDDEHDPEGVPLSAEWSRLSGLLDGARDELQQVDDALTRMDAGDYGVCANCGRSIPIARLRVRPFATRCVPCAEKLGR
ncbi:TraR/DksA C4-type zinc finger protein [Microbacterium profundi]|uniref:TraR/DksA family transcriptional regulator n=1 Tax=Microbacterium profundi TaxID=450380 RepID=UPI0027DF0856|nr:TraR/DksA C4-type zinc finger protein [Microbacterium profundi]MCE7483612.1 TraR/DksA C4-type zinc finger protein [Microbacterium profundi]